MAKIISGIIPVRIITDQPEQMILRISENFPFVRVKNKDAAKTIAAEISVRNFAFGKTSPISPAEMCRNSAIFITAVTVHTIR